MKQAIELAKQLIELLQRELYKTAVPRQNLENRANEFYYSIMLRSLSALDSATYLLLVIDKNPFCRYTYALIARTIIMDLIITSEVLNAEEESPEARNKLLDRIYNEHLISTYNSITRHLLFIKMILNSKRSRLVLRHSMNSVS